jgi:hypothetical protein
MGEEIFKTILWYTVLLAVISVTLGYEVLHAVNFGLNGQQTDSNGLLYQAYSGCRPWSYSATIQGTLEQNAPIYSHFCDDPQRTYEIPILDMKNGSYLLVLRMIDDGNMDLVSVKLNGLTHLENFSINNVVGTRHAYDEHIYFSICDEQLFYKTEKSSVQENKLLINMDGNKYANLAAVVLVRGDVENFPKLASSPNSSESELSKMALTTHRCETDNNINKNITSIINHGTMNINIHIN